MKDPNHWLRPAAGAVACAVLLIAFPPAGRAAGRRLLSNHVPPDVASGRLQPAGYLADTNRLHLAIGLPLRNQPQLDTLLRQLYDPTSPNYHHYLSVGQFTEKFGPSEADYQTLRDFARTSGLVEKQLSPNRILLDVDASVADIRRVFHVNIRTYNHPRENRQFYAPDTEPAPDLAVPLLHISGLDNAVLPHPLIRKTPLGKSSAKPMGGGATNVPFSGSGPYGTYIGNDFRNAYAPGVGLTGAGQNCALLEFDSYYLSDILAYEAQAGRPNVNLVNVPIDGGIVGLPGPADDEVSLDIEMVIAMASDISTIFVYESPDGPGDDILNRMATDDSSKQISSSWGYPGDATSEQIFQEMGLQGQSFFQASGDTGGFEGVVQPSTGSTNIILVGGTELVMNGLGESYESESVWGTGQYVTNSNWGSSGGICSNYPIPIWQQGISMVTNQGSTAFRNSPDVALTADGIYIVYENGLTGSSGGTSAAAPLWAGYNAMINEQAAIYKDPPDGFINPAVYAIGKGSNYLLCFHDTTVGNNFWPGSPTNFPAVPGYDLCTGWGTPTGSNIINALAPPGNIPVLFVVSETISNSTLGVIGYDQCSSLTFYITNEGSAAATSIQGFLYSTTLGAIVGQSTAGFPDLPPHTAAASTSPFTLSTEPSFVCGTPIDLMLVLTCAQNVRTNAVQLPTGILGPSVVFANSTSVTIPEGSPGGASTSVLVSNLASAAKITVSVYAQVAEDEGLQLQLISPNGTTVLLTSYPNGGLGSDYGTACAMGSQTTFDDGASTPIAAGTAPFVGSFQPQEPLASLLPVSGANLNGIWRLNAVDDFIGDAATLECWSLNVMPYACLDGGGQCPGSGLFLTMAASPNPVIVGSNMVFTLSVSNAGPSPATDVVISQTLPPGFLFDTTSNYPVQAVPNGSSVTLSLGALPVYGSAVIAEVVTPYEAGLATSTASVTSASPNPNPANAAASASTMVTLPAADLAISMSASTGSILEGGQVTFTFFVTNNGPYPATGVVLTNELPLNAVYVSSSNMSPGGLLADLGTLPVGSNAVASVTLSPTAPGSFTDSAQVGLSSLETDPNSLNNSASYTVTVGPSADLAVSASVSPVTVVAGQNCTYVATVVNNGPSGASDVVFSQTIPGGTGLNAATFVSSNPTNVTVTNGFITWNIGTLANGGHVAITNVLKTPVIQSGGRPITLSSTFTVFGQPGDANTNNNVVTVTNEAETPTKTIIPAGVTLTSQGGSSPNGAVNPGQTVGVQFYLQNTGNIPTTSLMATLQATGGVTAPTGPENYGALAPGGASGGMPFSFTASGTNGGTVVATLSLQDGSTSLGTVSYTFYLPVVQTFWNTNAIYIPAPQYVPYPDEGPGSPYPSTIQVSNISGYVSKVTVTVSNMYHTYPNDIGLLLAGPETNAVLMDAAVLYGDGITATTITFDSTATTVLPAEVLPGQSNLISGAAYTPANYNPKDVFTNAAAAPYGASLAVFNGLAANGSWMLYAHDDAEGDAGGIGNGWSLTITTVTPVDTANGPYVASSLEAINLEGGLQLTLSGQPGIDYAIQISSNLVNWTSVLTNTASLSNGSFIYTDTQTNAPMRFYRAIRLPQ